MPQGSNTVHDVVIIGSGAGGGTATKVLADLGISVLLLEAGPMLNMADLKEHMLPYHVPHRGAGAKGEAYTGGRTGFTYSATYGGAQIDGEPYTVAPGSDFSWFRSRILGGRTNHYGRITLRFADYDFMPKSVDGLGFDWPIRYEDLAPYYDKAENFIGVVGSVEKIRSAPDGIFQTPAPLRAHDTLVQRSCAKLGIRAVPARQAVITRTTNGRPPCHYCRQCGRGCVTASIILLTIQSQPLILLIISASIGGFMMFIYSGLLILINKRSLPPSARITRFRTGTMIWSVLLFGTASVIAIFDQWDNIKELFGL